MSTFIQDIRFACRGLRKSPGFALVTVLTLALGIGATTAVFSMVNGVLLRPLAYAESDRLVSLNESIPALVEKYPVLPVSARHFMEWREKCSSFESLALIDPGAMTLTGEGEPEHVEAAQVSTNLFETLRVRPARGRTLLSEEDEAGHDRVVVISHRFWRRKFNADPSIVGTAITLDNEAYTVVGVLPAGFRFPSPNPLKVSELAISSQPDLFTAKVFTDAERDNLMGMFNFPVVARLKDGVTCEKATAELDTIAAQLVKMAGEDMELRAVVKPLKGALVNDHRGGLLVVLSAIGSVLLIACLNLAILHLVRAERRSFDSAIRMALGASRVRILRQALTETLLLTALGTALGMLLASGGLDLLVRIAPAGIPRLDEVRIDANVLLFALLLMGSTALLCGTLPAWRTMRSRAEQVLKAGGRTVSASGLRLHGVLVMAEVGLGAVLLITAGLLLSSFARVMRTDKGFHAPTVLAVDLTPPETYDDWKRRVDFHKRLLDRLASVPGVRSAATASRLPLQGQTWVSSAWLAGDQRLDFERPATNVRFISAGYFQTMGIPLLAGRTFDDRDESRKVAVISQQLAHKLWPSRYAVVGRRFLHEGDDEYEVIGVAKDVLADADERSVAMLYRSYREYSRRPMVVVARAAGDPFSIAESVRQAIHSIDADLPISRMYTMREVLAESVSQRRFQMLLASAFGICALLLAGLGIYGVVSYAVARRTREMGIRMALGARPSDIYHTVLRRGMTPVVLGLIGGVVGACALGRLLRSLLYGTSPTDPLTIAAVVTVMFLTAIVACYIPARRAAKVDPMVALRYE